MVICSALSVLAYGRGLIIWLYRTGLPFSFVEAPGFYDRAAGMFENGDLIVVAAADGTGFRQISKADGAVTLQAPR